MLGFHGVACRWLRNRYRAWCVHTRMDLVEYVFGTGAGDPSQWVSPADLDLGEPGGFDAVALDFDGDGLRDDALWDSDGDGYADCSVLDVASASARYFTDPGGAGTWAVEVPAPVAAGVDGTLSDAPVSDAPVRDGAASAGGAAGEQVDTDGDGAPDVIVVHRGRATDMLVDTDGDGAMDLRLTDTDGDSRVDAQASPVAD